MMKLIENNKAKEVTENKLRLKANQLENIVSQNIGHVQLLEKQKINLEIVRILFFLQCSSRIDSRSSYTHFR